MVSNLYMILRLILAAVLGGLIGSERESHNRPAGLKTHILVTVGAALIMLLSKEGFDGQGDPARLAAQVVSGIGFLGAGTILTQGNSVYGLTTAATLWVCACIGLAVGNGYYLGSIITTAIVLFSLVPLANFQRKVFKEQLRTMHIIAFERPGLLGKIGTIMGKNQISIKHIRLNRVNKALETEGNVHIELLLKIPAKMTDKDIMKSIFQIDEVSKLQWDDDF